MMAITLAHILVVDLSNASNFGVLIVFVLIGTVVLLIFGMASILVYSLWNMAFKTYRESSAKKAKQLPNFVGSALVETGDAQSARRKIVGVGLGLTVLIIFAAVLAIFCVTQVAIEFR